jgi:hypothetical protein
MQRLVTRLALWGASGCALWAGGVVWAVCSRVVCIEGGWHACVLVFLRVLVMGMRTEVFIGGASRAEASEWHRRFAVRGRVGLFPFFIYTLVFSPCDNITLWLRDRFVSFEVPGRRGRVFFWVYVTRVCCEVRVCLMARIKSLEAHGWDFRSGCVRVSPCVVYSHVWSVGDCVVFV